MKKKITPMMKTNKIEMERSIPPSRLLCMKGDVEILQGLVEGEVARLVSFRDGADLKGDFCIISIDDAKVLGSILGQCQHGSQ